MAAVLYSPWPWEVPRAHACVCARHAVAFCSVQHVTHRVKVGQEVLIVQLCLMNCHYSKSWQSSKIGIVLIHKLALCSLAAYAQGVEYSIPEAVLPNRRRGRSVLEFLNSLQSLFVLSFPHALRQHIWLACIRATLPQEVPQQIGSQILVEETTNFGGLHMRCKRRADLPSGVE